MPTGLPKLPKVNLPANPLEPLKTVVRRSRERVEKAGTEIRTLGDELRGFALTQSQIHTRAPVAAKEPLYGVTDKDTLLYQLDHLVSVLKQLETHLSEGCKIMGVPCDCCGKHALEVRTFAMETIPIAARMDRETLIYQDIANWASTIEEIDTPEKVESGEYDENYRKESGTASKFRKKIQSMIAELKKEEECPGCEEMKETISEFIKRRKKQQGSEA